MSDADFLPIRALTLWQPWASLVSLGVKTIETRSWSTKYRGPLLIHAAKKKPPFLWSWVYRDNGPEYMHEQLERFYDPLECSDGETWRYEWYGPRGAFVATCELVDVVPMVAPGSCVGPCLLVIDETASADLLGSELWTWQAPHGDKRHPYLPWSDVGDQLPYGDFKPGRFAWLLENIKPLEEPVRATGHQGLWTVRDRARLRAGQHVEHA